MRGRAFHRGTPSRYRCGLCLGEGSVPRGRVRDLHQLREQMQRVADAMQAGDDERVAREARLAMRLAKIASTSHVLAE